MSTRPSFQFYPADWRNNAKLRRCSPAARGAWVDVLCTLHDEDDYGVAHYTLKELAQASGATLAQVKELAAKGVLKGADSGRVEYRWAPFHAGKRGAEVLLVDTDGPAWYCSRFVRDEHIRQRRGSSTRFTPDNQPTRPPNNSPTRGIGEPQGYGASSASASASSKQDLTTTPKPETERGLDTPRERARAPAVTPGEASKAMREGGLIDTRPDHPTLIALLERGATRPQLVAAARAAVDKGKGFAYALGALKGQLDDAGKAGKRNADPDAIHEHNRSVADAWLRDQQETTP